MSIASNFSVIGQKLAIKNKALAVSYTLLKLKLKINKSTLTRAEIRGSYCSIFYTCKSVRFS